MASGSCGVDGCPDLICEAYGGALSFGAAPRQAVDKRIARMGEDLGCSLDRIVEFRRTSFEGCGGRLILSLIQKPTFSQATSSRCAYNATFLDRD